MPAKEKVTSDKKQVTSKAKKEVTSRLASARSKSNEVSSVRAKSRTTSLSVPIFSLLGRAAGTLELPKDLFGAEVNNALLAQAIRVYQTNQSAHYSQTKTRGEVQGSTRKIYRQKGTGRARHGAIRAPIFVGGGIALGPKPRKTILDLPDKMKKKALISALSQKMADKKISGLSGLEKATGKTKEMANFLKKIESTSTLIVADGKNETALRATKNLKSLQLLNAAQLNTFQVLKYQNLLLTKEAVEKLKERLTK